MSAKTAPFEHSLAQIRDGLDISGFRNGLNGIEKESLRIDSNGALSKLAHPQSLGSALTNPAITTDFSEALLEFVTPAHNSFWETLQYLCDLHVFAHRQIGDELLWPTSMPCRVGSDENIPLAHYGSSNVGMMKTTYRRGLGLRYGRLMQTIAGLHFNFSIKPELWEPLKTLAADTGSSQEFRSAQYLGLIRNFRRYGWLVLYLFGASPAMCKSFMNDPYSTMPDLDDETVFEPYGTSLRMSDLGYSNKNQSRLLISLNNLDDYVKGLCKAITTPEPDYVRMGVKVDGQYQQLNANTLQIENEYYSPMRPKRVARSGERPTTALHRGGIEYIELRSLDLNVFDPIGISRQQAQWVELFLLYCLLKPSPTIDETELKATQQNHALTARSGRDPGLLLDNQGSSVLLSDWALQIFDDMAVLAKTLDGDSETKRQDAVAHFRRTVVDSELTPSARFIGELVENKQCFFEFGLERARQNRDYFNALQPVNESRLASFEQMAKQSLEDQKAVEAEQTESFEDYLSAYFNNIEC